jgi:hypothetical protein
MLISFDFCYTGAAYSRAAAIGLMNAVRLREILCFAVLEKEEAGRDCNPIRPQVVRNSKVKRT